MRKKSSVERIQRFKYLNIQRSKIQVLQKFKNFKCLSLENNKVQVFKYKNSLIEKLEDQALKFRNVPRSKRLKIQKSKATSLQKFNDERFERLKVQCSSIWT